MIRHATDGIPVSGLPSHVVQGIENILDADGTTNKGQKLLAFGDPTGSESGKDNWDVTTLTARQEAYEMQDVVAGLGPRALSSSSNSAGFVAQSVADTISGSNYTHPQLQLSAQSSRRSSDLLSVDTINNISHNITNSNNNTNSNSTGLGRPMRAPAIKCDLTGKRVLLVDDSPSNLKIVGVVLKKLGAQCDTVGDGAQAVELVRASLREPINQTALIGDMEAATMPATVKYDCIIMDNYMPVMNGPEACREMRKIGFSGPIFGLTGDCSQDNLDVFLSAGALYVFQKPFELNTMKIVLLKYFPQ